MRTPIAPILASPPSGPRCPYAHSPGSAPGIDVEIGECVDHPPLDRVDKSAHVTRPGPEIEHKIAYALTGAMVGVAPAAASLDHFKTRIQQFAGRCTCPGGVYGRVLQKPDPLRGCPICNRSIACGHFGQRLTIRHRLMILPDFDPLQHPHDLSTWPYRAMVARARIEG